MNFRLPHTQAPPELKRTYYGIYILAVIVLGVVLVNVFGNVSLRSDHSLETVIQNQHDAIESYASSHNKLPDIIADANISDTQGVEYKKISSGRYMLCATFKTKSTGFTNQPSPLLEGANLDLAANTKFSDGDADGLSHDKGFTCIYYQSSSLTELAPPAPSPVETGSRTECGRSLQTYTYRIAATITSVDTAKNEVILNQTGQTSFNGVNIRNLAIPLTALTYNDNTLFYNIGCNGTNSNELAAGESAYFYINTFENDALVSQIEVRQVAGTGGTVCTGSAAIATCSND